MLTIKQTSAAMSAMTFTGKSCFTTDGIILAELLMSVGLDISFDANTSSSPPAACKKCARKMVNCSTLFHLALQAILTMCETCRRKPVLISTNWQLGGKML